MQPRDVGAGVISNWLHRAAHWLDPSPCRCQVASYMAGWRRARAMELKSLSQPSTPEEERRFRERIADSEREVA
jgi:hypothetical protein